jgi:hypothetical protein
MATKKSVPYGGTMFSIYKISLSIDSKYINNNNIGILNNSNIISIKTSGEITKINIYANYNRSTKHLGRKCLNAIMYLIKNNVFKESFKIIFYNTINFNDPIILYSDFFATYIIKVLFRVTELEWVFDFYDLPLFSSIDIDNYNNNKCFCRYLDVYFSKDNKNGEHLIKNEKAFVTHYNVGNRIKSVRNIERVKIHQQGKYMNDLTDDLLNGTKEDVIIKILPMLRNYINDVLDKDSFILNKK